MTTKNNSVHEDIGGCGTNGDRNERVQITRASIELGFENAASKINLTAFCWNVCYNWKWVCVRIKCEQKNHLQIKENDPHARAHPPTDSHSHWRRPHDSTQCTARKAAARHRHHNVTVTFKEMKPECVYKAQFHVGYIVLPVRSRSYIPT